MHQHNLQEFRESQMQDTELRPVITWLEGGPPTNDSKVWGPKLWNNKDWLHLEDGGLVL